MKIKADVYLNGLKREINRKVQFNDNISMQKFCEYVIVAMNGNGKHLFQLVLNEEYSYLGPQCRIIDSDIEEMMEDLALNVLDLKVGDELMVNYDFKADWEIIIKISGTQKGNFDKEFEVISGRGTGILEDAYGIEYMKRLIKSNLDEDDKRFYFGMIKGYDDYINKEFDVCNANQEIVDYFEKHKELIKPKNYIMNVALNGFQKEIKRKIAVDSNVNLDKFCECIIRSMNGDMSHPFGMKRGKEYIDEEVVIRQDLNYLELKEKQRLKVVYDFGDNWEFNITVSKIEDNYGNKHFEVLSGKGYGIIDDCGGPWGLSDIFDGTNTDWGKHDINDFDLDETNRIIDIYF